MKQGSRTVSSAVAYLVVVTIGAIVAGTAVPVLAQNEEQIDYPPALQTPEERRCYRDYVHERNECLADYNYTVDRCANSDDNFFGRQVCYMATYYYWNSCQSAANHSYGACLSAAWAPRPPMPDEPIALAN